MSSTLPLSLLMILLRRCRYPMVVGHQYPQYVQQAVSPSFVDEWGPAIDRENAGFLKHSCFAPVCLPPGHSKLPGLWGFTCNLSSCKCDNTAEARYAVGGHRQMLGSDCFPNKNYSAVLSSCDNSILLRLLQLKAGLFIRLILCRPSFMVNLTISIFILIHLQGTSVLLGL